MQTIHGIVADIQNFKKLIETKECTLESLLEEEIIVTEFRNNDPVLLNLYSLLYKLSLWKNNNFE